MSVKIRLRRMGKKKQPMYRFVATDSRMPRDGRFLEVLGWYRPLEHPAKMKLNVPSTLSWLERGAQPSDTVASLFRHSGMAEIWEKKQRGDDVSGMEVKDALPEKQHKVKSKARARMVEQSAKEAEAAAAAKAEAEKPAEEAPAAEGESA